MAELRVGDLVRIKHAQPSTVHFARVFRVHQAYVDTIESLDRKPGEYASPFKRDCELINRPSENNEDYGFVALPESQLVSLAHLASVAGERSADALWAEVERLRPCTCPVPSATIHFCSIAARERYVARQMASILDAPKDTTAGRTDP